MSNVEKLKKKAAEFEQKKQFDRALEAYLQIINASDGQEEKDVTVYNRVGDLYLRLNKPDQAVNYYEQAVDLYADGGYLNNAIALCNKILRHAPSRHLIYYKLGKISAKKGFNSDAKKNFLEFADRMHRSGKDTEAFKALQEFADLCPGQDDIRLMLADQLAKAGKNPEAVEQLQILHESLDSEGRTAEAEATVQRMKTLDPNVKPRRSNSPREKESGGLVFLDLGASPIRQRPKVAGIGEENPRMAAPPRPKTPPHVQPNPEFERLAEFDPSLTPDEEMPQLEIETTALDTVVDEPEAVIEPAFDLSVTDLEISPLEGLESTADPTQFVINPESSPPAPASAIEGLESLDSSFDPGLGEAVGSEDPLGGLSILEDDRFYVQDENPLAGLGEDVAPEPEPEPHQAQPEIEPLELAVERDVAFEPPEPEPIAAEQTHVPELVRDDDEDEEEVEPPQPPPATPARSVKPTKPKLVSPVRPTRPKKPEKKKTPQAEQPVEERRPVNPFQRPRPKVKGGSPKASPRVVTPPAEVPRAETPRAATPKEPLPARKSDDTFVDLADWLREDSGPRSTRMIAEEDRDLTDADQADFTHMLEKFKAGVAANVDDEDFDSHYDLGIAYKEMGLIDEAVAEFQKALRGAAYRIRAYEALGQCFIDRREYDVAITVLGRALREPGMEDEDLIGVLYLLGFASEEGRKPRDAAAYYQRVFAIDIDFRDVSQRLKQMSKAASK